MENTQKEDSTLYFKGIILPKPISTNPVIDLENGFVLSDERKEKKKSFSTKEIYNAIKKQKPELLKNLLEMQVESCDKEELKKYLIEDKIISPSKNKIEVPKFENKLLNIIFNSLKTSLKSIFFKDSKLFISNSKITVDEKYCLGWFKSNTFEIYVFADILSSTFLEYYITGHSNTLKKSIDQTVLDEYKKLLIIWKEQFLKQVDTNIDVGVSIINKQIVQKHFAKNPKYYIIELNLEEDKPPLKLYITLKKVKNG